MHDQSAVRFLLRDPLLDRLKALIQRITAMFQLDGMIEFFRLLFSPVLYSRENTICCCLRGHSEKDSVFTTLIGKDLCCRKRSFGLSAAHWRFQYHDSRTLCLCSHLQHTLLHTAWLESKNTLKIFRRIRFAFGIPHGGKRHLFPGISRACGTINVFAVVIYTDERKIYGIACQPVGADQ